VDPRPGDDSAARENSPRVALFVTCLVDLFRPGVGFAAVELLGRAGCEVVVPELQTCCGQPALNSGDLDDARALARRVIEAFEGFDYVVAPSGSCAGTLRQYPGLFVGEPTWRERAQALADRSHELTGFLVDLRGLSSVPTRFDGAVTYHDSCSGLRELGVREQPRRLLASVAGLELREMQDCDVCCGFGGTFCVKYPELSLRMVSDKVRNIDGSGAPVLLGGDLGCLLNIAGRLQRLGRPQRVFHVAELLTGWARGPGIGEGEG
jgi:L-lactate dehydrogenase complex protein LldE